MQKFTDNILRNGNGDGNEEKKKDAPRPKLKILGEEVTVPKGNPRTPDWVDSEGVPHYESKGGRFGGPEK
ncbi:MAG TPA: hypothetical protein QF753_23150 [Victivallales bacterium]|nr:hypothetical protein [Victivallales bacterium]